MASTIVFTEHLVKIYQVCNDANHSIHKPTHKDARQARKYQTKTQLHAFTTQYATILASQIQMSEHLGFAPDCDRVVCNNSANAHICLRRHMFVGKIIKIDPRTGVATIRQGLVQWSIVGTTTKERHMMFSRKNIVFSRKNGVFFLRLRPSSTSPCQSLTDVSPLLQL